EVKGGEGLMDDKSLVQWVELNVAALLGNIDLASDQRLAHLFHVFSASLYFARLQDPTLARAAWEVFHRLPPGLRDAVDKCDPHGALAGALEAGEVPDSLPEDIHPEVGEADPEAAVEALVVLAGRLRDLSEAGRLTARGRVVRALVYVAGEALRMDLPGAGDLLGMIGE